MSIWIEAALVLGVALAICAVYLGWVFLSMSFIDKRQIRGRYGWPLVVGPPVLFCYFIVVIAATYS